MELYTSKLRIIGVFALVELIMTYFVSTPDVSLVMRLLTAIGVMAVTLVIVDIFLGPGYRLVAVPVALAISEVLINMYREYPTIPPLTIWQKAIAAGLVGLVSVFIANLLPTTIIAI